MNIAKAFDKASAQYDEQRKKLIPCFDDLYGIAIENMSLTTASPGILDLGAGTGLFSKMVLNKFPNAEIELIDIAEKMLEVAKERFNENNNVSIKVQDYVSLQPETKYDAIISSLSIHHLKDEDKIILYDNIYKWLKPGGLFINVDQVLAPTSYFEELYSNQWRNKVDNSGLDKETIKAAYERVKLDKRTPLTTQLTWLEEAGFKHVDCLYKYYDFVVFWCCK